MFQRIGCTFSLMKSSWKVLMADKEMLLFSLLSMLCCGLVIASFAIPLYTTGYWQVPDEAATGGQKAVYYTTLFLFYFCNYFVIIFFNSAIIACAIKRMRGGNPTVSDGLHEAASRLPFILGWAFFSATVGLILRVIEDRSQAVGKIIAGLLGTAWSIMTFLAVPVLVIEKTSPVETFKRSTALLKNTWGQQIVAGFSFGIIFFLLAIPAFVIGGLGLMAGETAISVIAIGVAIVYLILLGLVQSVLHAIFQAALYLYAVDGSAGNMFDERQIQDAIQQR